MKGKSRWNPQDQTRLLLGDPVDAGKCAISVSEGGYRPLILPGLIAF
jgi:hypothetical protein